MDFSVLLKDLRDVAEKYQGRSSEPQVSTHVYVDTFTKVRKIPCKVTNPLTQEEPWRTCISSRTHNVSKIAC